MIEQQFTRPYIEKLKRDPRTRNLMAAWVHQAMMEQEAASGEPHDQRQAVKAAHDIATRAVDLAMRFVLGNDAEYQMVCRDRDRLAELLSKQVALSVYTQVEL